MHLLVIIYDLDIAWAARAFRPLETNPPLIIDPDAILALPIAFQRFKPVSRQIILRDEDYYNLLLAINLTAIG